MARGFSFVIVMSMFYGLAFADCRKEVEQIAIAEAKKEDPSVFIPEETRKIKNKKAKKNQETYSTEIHSSIGSFVPVEVTVTKKDCKKISTRIPASLK